MSDFQILIPGSPPSINRTYKVVRVGTSMRLAKHANVESWQTMVSMLTKLAKPKDWKPSRRVRLVIDYWMPRAGRDGDGPLKALQDAVAHGLGINDSICLPCVRSNEVDKMNPRVVVQIENVE
jgi:Holliday junction resolvase RusA-like endonuclease